MTTTSSDQIVRGDRWAVARNLDAFGEGMFRVVRPNLGVTAFGINAKVMAPGASSKNHLHREQQEIIFVHDGEIKVTFGDGASCKAAAGALVRIDAGEAHQVEVVGDSPATLLLMGGRDGIVEGDAEFV